jgi:hypothetical protein
MKKIMQFRFEGAENTNNYPVFKDNAGLDVYDITLTAGNIFNDYKLISKIGIQGPIGLKFYLNNGAYPITIGKTGIYELDLEGIGRINSIRFDKNDITTFFPNDNLVNRLLVDIVYEGGATT